jgi:hypothetical protein
MSYLASFRKGWENENLARFILSRFAFVAHPSTVSDDIGSDFFCTLFEVRRKRKRNYLSPRNSFAIQIRSSDEPFDVSNKLEYLWDLEIPFLFGAVDQAALRLTVFSGEHLPIFFSHKGLPRKLEIEPCERTELDLMDYFTQTGEKGYLLRFPKITDVEAHIGDDELQRKTHLLSELCSLIYDNIASRKNGEYIFKVYGSDPPSVVTFAGSGSVRVFRDNFLKRLAEVFYNLKWIRERRPGTFNVEEFRVYEGLFFQLEELYGGSLPPYVANPFFSLKALVDGFPPG